MVPEGEVLLGDNRARRRLARRRDPNETPHGGADPARRRDDGDVRVGRAADRQVDHRRCHRARHLAGRVDRGEIHPQRGVPGVDDGRRRLGAGAAAHDRRCDHHPGAGHRGHRDADPLRSGDRRVEVRAHPQDEIVLAGDHVHADMDVDRREHRLGPRHPDHRLGGGRPRRPRQVDRETDHLGGLTGVVHLGRQPGRRSRPQFEFGAVDRQAHVSSRRTTRCADRPPTGRRR